MEKQKKLVRHLAVRLFSYVAATFDSFEKPIKSKIKKIIDISDDPEFEHTIPVPTNNKKLIEIFKLFLSPDYEVPKMPDDLLSHLSTLWFYFDLASPKYTSKINLPSSFNDLNSRIDYILSNVAYNVGLMIFALRSGIPERERINKSKKRKAKNKAERKQKIIECYYSKAHLCKPFNPARGKY